MPRSLRSWLAAAAVVLAAGMLVFWLAAGANRGFTKTSVAVEKTDDVTGLTYREYEQRFVPGVELLALGLAGAAGLYVASRFLRG